MADMMDAILQNWPILVAGALGGITTLGSGLATRRYYLQWRAKRKRLLLIAYNRKQARLQKGTIDGTTVLVDAEAEVRPRAIARMASLVLLVLDFGDWVRTLPFKLIDMMLGIVGRMASLVDPAVTRNKSLKECVKEARIAWRRRFAPAREAWLFKNPEALASVIRGLEQSKAGLVVEYSPSLDDIYTDTEEG